MRLSCPRILRPRRRDGIARLREDLEHLRGETDERFARLEEAADLTDTILQAELGVRFVPPSAGGARHPGGPPPSLIAAAQTGTAGGQPVCVRVDGQEVGVALLPGGGDPDKIWDAVVSTAREVRP